jgi:hypothetical protein
MAVSDDRLCARHDVLLIQSSMLYHLLVKPDRLRAKGRYRVIPWFLGCWFYFLTVGSTQCESQIGDAVQVLQGDVGGRGHEVVSRTELGSASYAYCGLAGST